MEKHEQQTREDRAEQQKQSAGKTARQPERANMPQEARSLEALLSGNAVFDLPTQYLEELASLLGNTGMEELLGGGGEKPETFAFTRLGSSEAENTTDLIHTSSPELYDASQTEERGAPPGRAAYPWGIRERSTPGKSLDLFGSH